MRPVVILLPALVLCIAADPARAQSQPATAAWALAGEQLVSALRVATAQLSTAGQVKAAGEQQSRQSFVGAVNSQAGADRIATARATYGADTGQGYGVCATPVALESRSLAEKSSVDVAAAYAAADRSWLANGGDAVERAAGLQDARKSFYCTDEERAATGWCRPKTQTGIPAGDTNAAVFMKPDLGPEEAMTAADYIDTAAPLPTVRAQVRDAEDVLARAEARRRGGLMTAARQTMFSVVNAAMGGNDGAAK